MKTDKLYQRDVYLKTCRSAVEEVICDREAMKELGAAMAAAEKSFLIRLDQSVFFPEGGGQPSDTGTIENWAVTYVFEHDGAVYHQVIGSSSEAPAVGSEVTCTIDWNRRFRHMQMHCGEHILSGMFYQEFGGVNRGFHLGEDYMTIDISLEENPDCTEMTPEMVARAEWLANEAVWSNVPVITRYYDTKEEAEGLPLRKALAIDTDITIVCVGSVENPADCVACCGTHPATSGQVGLIKITKAESYKGMTRLYVKAGSVAFSDYVKKHDIVAALNKRHSVEADQLLERIKVQDEKNGAVRKELYDLKKSVIAQAASELLELAPQHPRILVREFEHLGVDDVQTLGRQVTESLKGLLMLIATRDNTVMLFSQGNPDCGKLVKENASIYQGKGGGNNTCARAIFQKRESLDTYIDLIEKHLR